MKILAIKNDAGEWVLDVLGNPYGGPMDRDSDGEYFNADTQFHEDKFPPPPIVYYHGYDPTTKKPQGDPEYIGKAISRERRNDGVWYRVILDKANQAARKVWEAAQKGLAVASSGSIAHLARVDRTGHIRQWPVVELSLWDNDGSRPQANRHAVAIPAMKMMYQQAGIALPDDIEQEPEAEAKGPEASGQSADAGNVHSEPQSDNNKEVATMSDEQKAVDVEARVESAMKAFFDRQEAEKKAAEAQQAKIDEAIEAATKKVNDEWAAKFRLPDGGMKAPHQS